LRNSHDHVTRAIFRCFRNVFLGTLSRSLREGYGAPSTLSEDRSTVIHKVEHAYVGSRAAGGCRWTKRQEAKRT